MRKVYIQKTERERFCSKKNSKITEFRFLQQKGRRNPISQWTELKKRTEEKLKLYDTTG